MFAFNPDDIDDDDYLLRYATACDPDGKPVAREELPNIRAIFKLEYNLPPRDDAERELMASYTRLVHLIKQHPAHQVPADREKGAHP